MIFTKLPFMPGPFGWAWLILSLLAFGAKPLGDPSSLRTLTPTFDPLEPEEVKFDGSTISSTFYIPSNSHQTIKTNSPPKYSPQATINDIHGIGLTKSSNGPDSTSDTKKPIKRNALAHTLIPVFANVQQNLRRILGYHRLPLLPHIWTPRPLESPPPPSLLYPTRTIHFHLAVTRVSVDPTPAPPTTAHGWHKNQVLESLWCNRYALGCWVFTCSLSALVGILRFKKSVHCPRIDLNADPVSELGPEISTPGLGASVSPATPVSVAETGPISSGVPAATSAPPSTPGISPTTPAPLAPPFSLGSPIQLATPVLDDYLAPRVRPAVSDSNFHHWLDGKAHERDSVNPEFLDLSERAEVKLQLAAHLVIPGQRRLPVFYRSDSSFIERYMMDDFLELGVKWAFGEAQKAVQRYHPDAGDLGATIDVCVRVTSTAFEVETRTFYEEGLVAEWPLSLDVDAHEYAFCISVQVQPGTSTPVCQAGTFEPPEAALLPNTTDDAGVILEPIDLRVPLFSSTYDSRPSLLLPDPEDDESQSTESYPDIDLFSLTHGTSDEIYNPVTPPRRSWQSFEQYDAFEYEQGMELTSASFAAEIEH